MRPIVLLTVVVALASGCAARAPIANAPLGSPAPYLAGEQIERYLDTEVLWGGTIVDTRSFDRYTELEIVAYPLDGRQRPALDAPEQGRFIALRAGRLDPREFAPGRFVTLRGPITGDRIRELRGRRERMAEVDAREIVLWPWDYRFRRSSVSVGIGISGRL